MPARASVDIPKLAPGEVIDGKYRVVGRIGKGASGSVYQVIQIGLDVPRALKVLDPEPIGVQRDLFERTFAEEIKILSGLTHKNVVKIIDAASTELGGQRRYFVMEYVDGGTLDEVCTEVSDPVIILQLLHDVFEGLSYIHARRILHHDIKPKNIVVQRDVERGAFEAKLSDLGVAKVLLPWSGGQPELFKTRADLTYVWGSETYLPRYMWPIVNSGEPIARAELQRFMPHVDLFCAGATIVELLSVRPIKRAVADEYGAMLKDPRPELKRAFGNDRWEYLCDFVRQLLVDTPEMGYRTANDAQQALLRIEPRRAMAIRVPELTTVGSEHRIAVGERVARFTDRAFEVINHPCFQRLRNLNQLNFLELIYPGARHTRMAHSLEAYDVAKRVVEHLLGDRHFRLIATAEDINLFLLSALVHDIGHYPLAHAIEDLRDGPLATTILADFEMANSFLNRSFKGSTLAAVIARDWQIDAARIAALLSKSPEAHAKLTPIENLLRLLLDGAIDVDKIAYLVYDSRNTGVSYGLGIDVDALISGLAVMPIDGVPQLVLTHKSVSPAEAMIAARYHMFARVYWHHANRAIMAMIRYVVERLFQTFSFDRYITETLTYGDAEALRYLATAYDTTVPTANVLGNPIDGIVAGERALYKRLVSFSAHPENIMIRRCHDYLAAANADRLELLRQQCRMILSKATGMDVHDSWILLDVPRLQKEYEALTDVMVVDPQSARGYMRLKDISKMLGAVFDEFQTLVKKSRLFIHPQLRERLRRLGVEQQTAGAVEAKVYEHACGHA